MSNVAAHLVRIHIDREAYESPSPTSGGALYALASIAPHRELFREVGGDKEDEVIPRSAEELHLMPDEHFYSQKVVVVVVNGEAHEVAETRLSFEELVKIAYPAPPKGLCIEFTVTYRDGPPANPKGTLTAGHIVKIKNKMKFDVTATDRS
jgi:hypothetical protein